MPCGAAQAGFVLRGSRASQGAAAGSTDGASGQVGMVPGTAAAACRVAREQDSRLGELPDGRRPATCAAARAPTCFEGPGRPRRGRRLAWLLPYFGPHRIYASVSRVDTSPPWYGPGGELTPRQGQGRSCHLR